MHMVIISVGVNKGKGPPQSLGLHVQRSTDRNRDELPVGSVFVLSGISAHFEMKLLVSHTASNIDNAKNHQ